MTIYKFALEVTGAQSIYMPRGAELLSVQFQHDVLCLWALVDPSSEPEKRRIAIYGTGAPIPEECGAFVGTVQMMGGSLVWHVFDKGAA